MTVVAYRKQERRSASSGGLIPNLGSLTFPVSEVAVVLAWMREGLQGGFLVGIASRNRGDFWYVE